MLLKRSLLKAAVITSVALLTVSSAVTMAWSSDAETYQQRLLFDHTGSQTASSYWQPNVNQPLNYTSPINYSGGKFYARIDVTSKPSSLPVRALLCFWRHTETVRFQYETCRGRGLEFTDEGVYYADLGAPESWWQKEGGYDWRQQASVIRVMISDLATGKLLLSSSCGHACFPGDVSGHVPIEYRTEIVMVPQGGSLTPPAHWRADCPSSWSPSCGTPVTTTTHTSTTTAPVTTTTTTTTTTTMPPTTTSSVTTTTTPQTRKRVLLLTNTGRLTAADLPIATAIEELGFEVSVKAESAITQWQVLDASAVFISSNVAPNEIPKWLATVSTPVISNEVYSWRMLGMATSVRETGRDVDLTISGRGRLSAGLRGEVVVSTTPTPINVGTPGAGAKIVATASGDLTAASIFSYAPGSQMAVGLAPGKRLAFYQTVETPKSSNENGTRLLKAAIVWAAS